MKNAHNFPKKGPFNLKQTILPMPDFTPEDLILYLYGETDDVMTARIKTDLDNNWALREKLSVLKLSMDRLDNATIESPSPASLEAIMAYAREKSKVVR